MIGKSLPLMLILGARDNASRVVQDASARIRRAYDRIGGQGAMARLRVAGEQFRWTGGHVRSLAVGLGAAAGAAGTAFFAMRRFASEGDRVAKTAARLGMGVEALQEYEFAAGQSGVAQEQFTASMIAFNRALGEARAGTGALYEFLERRGVSPNLMRDLLGAGSTENALDVMLSSIAKLETAERRMALANKAFGGSGAQMVNLAMAGPEAIAQLRATARELGLLSDAAAKAAEANVDSWDRTTRAFKGTWFAIAEQLLPFVTEAQDRWTKTLLENRSAIVDWAQSFGEGLPDRIKAVESAVVELGKGVKFLVDVLKQADGLLGSEDRPGSGLVRGVLGYLGIRLGISAFKAGKVLIPAAAGGGGAASAAAAAVGGAGAAEGLRRTLGRVASGKIGGSIARGGAPAIARAAAGRSALGFLGPAGWMLSAIWMAAEAGKADAANPEFMRNYEAGIRRPQSAAEARATAEFQQRQMNGGWTLPIELTVKGLPAGVSLDATSNGSPVPVRRGPNLPTGTGGL